MEQRWEDSNKASNGKESVAKIGREGYLAKSCRTAMSCKLLEKKYFAKFLRFAKIFQTCLAKPSQYVANSQISQKQLHKCEGEEEALVSQTYSGSLRNLVHKSIFFGRLQVKWQKTSLVGEQIIWIKKNHIRTPKIYNLVRMPFRFKTNLSRDKFKGMKQNLDRIRVAPVKKKIVAQ